MSAHYLLCNVQPWPSVEDAAALCARKDQQFHGGLRQAQRACDNVYVYVRVYVNVYACICMYICECMYVCMHVPI